MKTYKNYMVVEISKDPNVTDWVIGIFKSHKRAVTFCNDYIPRLETDRLEVQATDEDVDICVNIDTIYTRRFK